MNSDLAYRREKWKQLKKDYMTMSYYNFASNYTPDLFFFSFVWFWHLFIFRIIFSMYGFFGLMFCLIVSLIIEAN